MIPIPVQGFDRSLRMPNDPASIGENRLMQVLVRDGGASRGMAFSRGLRLTIGM